MSSHQETMNDWLEKYRHLIGKGLEEVGEDMVSEALKDAVMTLEQLDQTFVDEADGGEDISRIELKMPPNVAKVIVIWAAYGHAALHQRLDDGAERIL